jgi:ketosteroid isomerase-like protein
MNEDTIRKLFRQIDQLNQEEIVTWFAEDATLRVGLDDPVQGRANVGEWFSRFFSELKGSHHKFEHIWEIPGGYVVEAHAVFRVRGHVEPVIIPGATVVRTRGDKIASARVYYDLHELREVISNPDRVFEGIDATFPASDPPAWSG